MAPEAINNSNHITPEAAEKKVSEAIGNIVEDEDYVIEEDGDFFWVIQRIAWGIIKTLLVLAMVGSLIWLIWGGKLPFFGSDNTTSAPVRIETPAETGPSDEPGFFSKLFNKDKSKKDTETDKTSVDIPPAETNTAPVVTPQIVNNINLESLSYSLAAKNVTADTGGTISRTTQ